MGGGDYIEGNVGGDYIGGDKITIESGGIAISGNNVNSPIITGNNNIIGSTINQQAQFIQQIYTAIENRPDTDPLDKDDLKANVDEIKAEDAKGDQADETFIARRLRNIQRMAPDILEVVVAIITNPVAGFGVITKKVAEKMKAGAG